MIILLSYSFFTLISLAIPLMLYKHSRWTVLGACLGELVVILFIYSSTFVLCTDKEACGSAWAARAIPTLIAAMNIGMLWPILAAYAKQDKLKKEQAQKTQEQE